MKNNEKKKRKKRSCQWGQEQEKFFGVFGNFWNGGTPRTLICQRERPWLTVPSSIRSLTATFLWSPNKTTTLIFTSVWGLHCNCYRYTNRLPDFPATTAFLSNYNCLLSQSQIQCILQAFYLCTLSFLSRFLFIFFFLVKHLLPFASPFSL